MSEKKEGFIEAVRGEDRFRTKIDWLDGKHSFSFGPDWDMEIVTWMISGELEHKDSAGNVGIIYPGLAQRISAGSGIYHSEILVWQTDVSE